MTQEQSDIFCRGVTGEGNSKRTLYSDDDDTIYNYKRCIGYNGVNIAGTASDLLDRSIVFNLKSIDNDKRRTEKELWHNFNRDKNDILKGIFSTLSKAMEILPNIKIKNLPRMADFTLYGCAIAEALGYTQDQFLKAYYGNQKILNEEVVESDIVGSYIMKFVDEIQDSFKPYEYRVTDFYDKLTEYARKEGYSVNSKSWPKSSSGLSRKINRIRRNLKEEGIEIDHISGRDWKKYIITNHNPKKPLSKNEDISKDYEDDPDVWES